MKWADVAEPARTGAESFPVWHQLERSLKGRQHCCPSIPKTKRIFCATAKKTYENGEIFKQPELDDLLRALIKDGTARFYGAKNSRN